MHLCLAAVLGKLAHCFIISLLSRNMLNQLADNVAQSMSCCCRAMWLAMRLEYWMSFCRWSRPRGPVGFMR